MVTTKTKPTKPDSPAHDDHGRGANIMLSIHLGSMVSVQIEGSNCTEIAEALKGFEDLNRTVGAMLSDLANLAYPDLGDPGKASAGKD
jgi:hypothetical protein